MKQLFIHEALQKWAENHCFKADELEALARKWAAKRVAAGRASGTKWPAEHFRFAAMDFLRSIGRLRPPSLPSPGRYDDELADFIATQQQSRWLSSATRKCATWQIKRFLSYLQQRHRSLRNLTPTDIDALLAVPHRQRPQGRRDYALLLFLYNTGARASEVAGVTIGDLSLSTTPSVRLFGKGRKVRMCPLWKQTADTLRELLGSRLDGPADAPLFLNVRGQPVTRFGIYKLVVRNTAKAIKTAPSLGRKTISPHTIRHTSAVHLLRAGVDINTIRAWLGHLSLETTNRYAEADLEMKAKALEICAVRKGKAVSTPLWRNTELMSFLASL